MSEERRKSEIDEIKEAMDNYLSKSADFIDPQTQVHQDIKSKPSLTVSEFQIHSETLSLSPPQNNNKIKKFYQFIFIAVMIASLSILISLIFHFFELKRHKANHQAYYKYLHKALEIKQENTKNESIIKACHAAIHDMDIITVYKAANIDVSNLKVDIEDLYEMGINAKHKHLNKKHELIIMCDIELKLMINSMKEEMKEYNRLNGVQKSSKQHDESYYKYLQKAIKIKQQHPLESILAACHSAIDHMDIKSIYKAANVHVANLKIDIEKLEKIKYGNHKHLNDKEELIIICKIQLELMTNAIDDEIQQTHHIMHEPTEPPTMTIEIIKD